MISVDRGAVDWSDSKALKIILRNRRGKFRFALSADPRRNPSLPRAFAPRYAKSVIVGPNLPRRRLRILKSFSLSFSRRQLCLQIAFPGEEAEKGRWSRLSKG